MWALRRVSQMGATWQGKTSSMRGVEARRRVANGHQMGRQNGNYERRMGLSFVSKMGTKWDAKTSILRGVGTQRRAEIGCQMGRQTSIMRGVGAQACVKMDAA